MKAIALTLALLLIPSLSSAQTYGNAVVDEVTSVYDADTFRVTIKSWPAVAGERVPVRVKGIDAPELRGKCQAEKEKARQAKQFTVAALRGAKRIELQELERDKYFRLLADVKVDGKDLGAQLLAAGLARPYDGGTKKGWCE